MQGDARCGLHERQGVGRSRRCETALSRALRAALYAGPGRDHCSEPGRPGCDPGKGRKVKNRTRARWSLLLLLGSLGLSACSEAAASDEAAASNNEVTVYATPTCGCCSGWIEHLREHGFTVRVVYQNDLSAIRAQHHLPEVLASCHMGVVEGYAVEGHVPADVIQRMLREKPEILGIAAPGMPVGSPGMEMPDGRVDPSTSTGAGPQARLIEDAVRSRPFRE
jgi:hypothetical protein